MHVCVAAHNPGLDHLLASPAFAVHVFGREQHGLARHGRDVSDLAGWRRERDVPVRSDVVACLYCERASVSRYGGHAVVVGTITEVVAAGEREPLIRLRRRTDWQLTERALVASGGDA